MKYFYELRAGNKLQRLIGEICVSQELIGKTAVFPYCDELHGRKIKRIEVPIEYFIEDYRTFKICLDVNHKTKKQINILLENFSELK